MAINRTRARAAGFVRALCAAAAALTAGAAAAEPIYPADDLLEQVAYAAPSSPVGAASAVPERAPEPETLAEIARPAPTAAPTEGLLALEIAAAREAAFAGDAAFAELRLAKMPLASLADALSATLLLMLLGLGAWFSRAAADATPRLIVS